MRLNMRGTLNRTRVVVVNGGGREEETEAGMVATEAVVAVAVMGGNREAVADVAVNTKGAAVVAEVTDSKEAGALPEEEEAAGSRDSRVREEATDSRAEALLAVVAEEVAVVEAMGNRGGFKA
jgi:hypothetical protein